LVELCERVERIAERDDVGALFLRRDRFRLFEIHLYGAATALCRATGTGRIDQDLAH